MYALAESALNEHYREVWDAACYTDESGYIKLTSYGEWLGDLSGRELLAEFCPWADSALNPREVDHLLHFICGCTPLPSEQLTLF